MVIYKYLLHTKCHLILINSTCQQLQICHWCEKTILVRDRDFHKVTRFAIGSPGLAYSSIDFFPTPHFSIPHPKPFHSVIECQIGIFLKSRLLLPINIVYLWLSFEAPILFFFILFFSLLKSQGPDCIVTFYTQVTLWLSPPFYHTYPISDSVIKLFH